MTGSGNFEDQAGLSFLSVRHVILNQLFIAVIDPGVSRESVRQVFYKTIACEVLFVSAVK